MKDVKRVKRERKRRRILSNERERERGGRQQEIAFEARGDTSEGARIPKKRPKPQSQVTRVKFKDANPNPGNVYSAPVKRRPLRGAML